MPDSAAPHSSRPVIVGRNSKVWGDLMGRPQLAGARAIGHAEIASASFDAGETVWVLSYSRDATENTALFEALKERGAARCVYVSTATANVTDLTGCYQYPRVKRQAEQDAIRILEADIVRIGIVYDDEGTLPGGTSAVTSLDQIAEAMAGGALPTPRDGVLRLFEMRERAFGSSLERGLHALYGRLIWGLRRMPCLLRPVDVLLKIMGFKWYGYVCLSNQIITRSERADDL